MMNATQIAHLKRLIAAATPGRWEHSLGCLNNWPRSNPQPDTLVEFVLNTPERADADGELLAAARNELPGLLAEVKRLREALVVALYAMQQNIAYATRKDERALAIGIEAARAALAEEE